MNGSLLLLGAAMGPGNGDRGPGIGINAFLSVWEALRGDEIRGLGETGLMWATEAGLAALPIALVALLVNLLGRRWLSAGQMGIVWCLVLVRLLLPAAPVSPFSLHNLGECLGRAEDPGDGAQNRLITAYAAPSASPVAAGPVVPHPTRMPIPSAEYWFDFVTGVFEVLWLVAAVGILAWTAFAHWRFCRRVGQSEICRDARLLSLWDDCCLVSGIRDRLPLVVFDGVQQPAVMGLVRPQLLLPPHALALADEELRMVMRHELAHVLRWDLALNWGLVILRALHWWNPVYWIAASRFRSLREQACDAFVVRETHGPSSRDYSELLLKLAQQVPVRSRWQVILPASLLGLFQSYFRTREVRLRLKSLRSAGIRRGRWQAAAFAVLALLVALCGLTDAEPPAPVPAPDISNWLPPGFDGNTWRAPDEENVAPGPLEIRVYAIEEIRSRQPNLKLDHEQVRRVVESLVAHMLHYTRSQADRKAKAKQPVAGEDTPGGTFVWDGDRLVLRASAALHDQLAAMFSVWDAEMPAQIIVECQMLTSAGRELMTAAGIEWQSLGAESPDRDQPLLAAMSDGGTVVRASSRVEEHVPVFFARLNDQQVKTLRQSAQGEARSNLLFAPKVTLFNGQEAVVRSHVNRPFLVGMTERAGEEPQPRIETINEGTKLRLRALLHEDGRHIRLSGTIELASIENVQSVSASTAAGIRSVQVPRVRTSRIAVASDVEDGQSLVLGCLPSFERKEMFYVLLRVNRLTE